MDIGHESMLVYPGPSKLGAQAKSDEKRNACNIIHFPYQSLYLMNFKVNIGDDKSH